MAWSNYHAPEVMVLDALAWIYIFGGNIYYRNAEVCDRW